MDDADGTAGDYVVETDTGGVIGGAGSNRHTHAPGLPDRIVIASARLHEKCQNSRTGWARKR